MKDREPLVYYSLYESISPEVAKAQRMAELEQIAKYRRLKLQQYQDWSDPVKHAAIIAAYNKERAEAYTKLGDIPAEHIAVRTGRKYFRDLNPFPKPLPVSTPKKPTFWERVCRFFKR